MLGLPWLQPRSCSGRGGVEGRVGEMRVRGSGAGGGETPRCCSRCETSRQSDFQLPRFGSAPRSLRGKENLAGRATSTAPQKQFGAQLLLRPEKGAGVSPRFAASGLTWVAAGGSSLPVPRIGVAKTTRATQGPAKVRSRPAVSSSSCGRASPLPPTRRAPEPHGSGPSRPSQPGPPCANPGPAVLDGAGAGPWLGALWGCGTACHSRATEPMGRAGGSGRALGRPGL